MNDLTVLNKKINNTKNDCFANDELEKKLDELYKISNNHSIWKNPLLVSCENGQLSLEDFQFLFSQYYCYSKNFTRYLAALMVNCENDYFRSKLSQNLWEEGGGADIEQRHAEIYRRFLTHHLKIRSLDDIYYKSYAHDFANEYLNLSLYSSPLEAAAALSFGTEGIVSRLYTIMKTGLIKLGFSEESLIFFNLHIECDDDHALTILEIAKSYCNENDWFEKCKNSMIKALDARDAFFKNIYRTLQEKKLKDLIEKASKKQLSSVFESQCVFNTDFSKNTLYKNHDEKSNIRFTVQRLPFNADILDPRLVVIPTGYTNELHEHAHETVFLILEGEGRVIIGNNALLVKKNDVVYVPRWIPHQTQNTGSDELKFFAVTDYGFTRCFAGNTETTYRKNN